MVRHTTQTTRATSKALVRASTASRPAQERPAPCRWASPGARHDPDANDEDVASGDDQQYAGRTAEYNQRGPAQLCEPDEHEQRADQCRFGHVLAGNGQMDHPGHRGQRDRRRGCGGSFSYILVEKTSEARDTMAGPTDVGEQIQLFFDLDRVQMIQDVTQVVHQPAKHHRNPLIRGDRPWEKVLYFVLSSGNVLYSPSEALFRLWYEDLGFEHAAFMADPNPYPWDHMMLHYLYATSKDGVIWDKPALDVVPTYGPGTNVIWGTPEYKVHVLSVVDDPRAAGTDRRFKGIYVHPTVARGPGHEIRVGWSPDGIRWTTSPALPDFGAAGSHLGDVLIMSYDATINRFVLLTRHPRMSGEPGPDTLPRTRSLIRPRFPNDLRRENRRRIYRSESEDLLTWTEPELVFAPDDEDDWEDTFFGMVQFRRGPLMIGLLSVFHTVENSWNVQLAFSRDNGHSWRRVGKRQPFLGYGPNGAWDRWCVSSWSQPIIRGDQIWMYYGGAINHHDYWWSADHAEIDLEESGNLAKVDHGMGLATLRLDGFVSASAFYRQGIIVTHTLCSSQAGRLELNARTRPGGSVAVELTDSEDHVLEGFSRAACDPFVGDAVAHPVSWQGRSELPQEARGAGVKLRFYLKQADLFSHRFAPVGPR